MAMDDMALGDQVSLYSCSWHCHQEFLCQEWHSEPKHLSFGPWFPTVTRISFSETIPEVSAPQQIFMVGFTFNNYSEKICIFVCYFFSVLSDRWLLTRISCWFSCWDRRESLLQWALTFTMCTMFSTALHLPSLPSLDSNSEHLHYKSFYAVI